MIDDVPRLKTLDFSPLRHQPRLDYATQTTIPTERIDQLGAAFVYYADVGLVARYLDGEYLGEWRDKHAILSAVGHLVSPEDKQHITRILDLQVPAEFNWEEPAWHKVTLLNRGNAPGLSSHPDLAKTLNKEERNHHLMPFPSWVCRFASSARHTKQAIIAKEGKKSRVVWDGTDKAHWFESPMNEVTPTVKEADITFGCVYMAFCVWLWNLRISFPDEEIYLAFIDISSCFRWPRISPDLVGAFGFVVGSIYFAANAMVFGSVVSASTWEPFRRAIAALATALYHTQGLIRKHWSLLELIKWDRPPDAGTTFVRATPCSLHLGVYNTDGTRKPTPHLIYVDDNLLADVKSGMLRTLAAAAEAIYTVLGFPALGIRQCAIALDKWKELFVSHRLVLLGLEFDTRQMTVGIPDEYRREVCGLLNTHWHSGRRSFTINEIETLIGKLGRIGQAFRPIYHLMGSMYKSVAHCLRSNEQYKITVSGQFRALVNKAKQPVAGASLDEAREIRFAIKKASQQVHRCTRRYWICKSLREEIAFVTRLMNDFTIPLATPIGHIVPRTHDFVAAGDACPEGGGGWSTYLSFFWHLHFTSVSSQRRLHRIRQWFLSTC